ncbi:MAG: thioredoxin domain-containing protein [Flavobacteriales bacterium]|nr:thioredoxin domain-containing protein [Flavobacteriales bacterium]
MTLKKIFFLAITFLISFPNFGQQRMNELNNEKSLYLKQHSTNPVDWMPWSRNALSLAKSQKKLIIISVGYSSCHWCHVMEEETFSDEGAAKIMNEKFINIKVDREERPDIDELYMNSLVLMTGSGGWPMNIIALPDGSPIWGGTYLPKDNWINVLNQINDLYTTRYEDVLDYSKKLKLGLKPKKIIENKFASSELLIKIKKATKLSFSSVDIVNGGLRSFQKFHLPSMINYFLRVGKQFNEKKYSKFVDTTLKNISYGGINDHVEGGLHRYTVDSIWHVPHFEKMLYDNAQMLSVYAKAHRSSKKKLYKNEIDRIFNFFQNNLSGNNGLLYSSISAVTELGDEKIEGDYYVWDQETLKNILGKNFELFQDYFNVNKIGFWEKNKYVLKRENDDEFFTKKYNISIKSLESKISESLQILRKSRDGRKKPITDKKVLTSWNSLSVIGLSEAYQSTSEIKFLEKAQDILSAIENNLINENYDVQRSLSSSEDNVIFLEDYSYLISAYLSLYQSTFDNNYIDKADKLTKKALILFAHEESPFLIFSSDKSLFFSENLFVNQDGVMPSANSVMSKNLFLLSHYTGNRDYYDLGKSMIDAITNNTIENALDYMNWLNVSLDYNDEFFEVVISGKNSFEMAKEINSMYFPNILIAASKKDSDRYLLKNRYIKGENLIYVCVNNTCKFPVNNVEEALNLITQNDEKK